MKAEKVNNTNYYLKMTAFLPTLIFEKPQMMIIFYLVATITSILFLVSKTKINFWW